MTIILEDHMEQVLNGKLVSLTPLTLGDTAGLAAIGLDPRIWAWDTRPVRTASDMATYVATALADRADGLALPFTTRLASTGEVIGSTRFANISPSDLRAEIGWTWVAPRHWRTGVNVEAKLLMLGFAFETLGLRRLELKTDERNERSRAAIEALGATFEGTLRKHMVVEGGGVRNSVYYSILDEEWPAVKDGLVRRMARPAESGARV